MAKTAILPASVMQSATPRKTQGDIQGLNYMQIPGTASSVAVGPGSVWVLSDQPAGPDKYIWHNVGGTWTNVPGLASRISVGPDGTLYAINSGGGAYAYNSGAWNALGGGCRDVTAAADGSVYVISNGGGADGAIWHYSGGAWTQQPGSGNRLAASWDTHTYSLPGGTITPGGFYVINSQGSIYYLGASGYIQIPGAGSAVAPIAGGLFVLGYPTDPNGNVLYYYNLDAPGWSVKGGAGVSISANGSTLYIIGASGGIYVSAITVIPPPTPSPSPSPPSGIAASFALTPLSPQPLLEGNVTNGFTLVGPINGVFSLTLKDHSGNVIPPASWPAVSGSCTPNKAICFAPSRQPGLMILVNNQEQRGSSPVTLTISNSDGSSLTTNFLVNNSSIVYVADSAANTVRMYDEDGNLIPAPASFTLGNAPVAIAADYSSASLLVAGADNSIVYYNLDGTQNALPPQPYQNVAGPSAIFDTQLFPQEIAIADSTSNTVTIYDLATANQYALSPGTFAGLQQPSGIVRPLFAGLGLGYLVSSRGNNKVLAFNSGGDPIALSGGFPGLNAPSGLVASELLSRVWVTNAGNSTISVFDSAGNPVSVSGSFPGLSAPSGITASSSLYVLNGGNATVTVYDFNGNRLSTPGSFPGLMKPTSILIIPPVVLTFG
jgi:hypothetical protein